MATRWDEVKDVECYTKVTIEVVDPQGQKLMCERYIGQWDVNSTDLARMCHDAMLGMGFHPDSVAENFNFE